MNAQNGHRLPGVTGSKDEVTGLIDLTYSVWVDSLDEALEYSAPVFRGLALKDRKFSNWDMSTDEAGMQVDLHYQGADVEKVGQVRWSFDNSFREERIESHPLFSELKNTFGGDVIDGKVVWPEILDQNQIGDLSIGFSRTEGDEKTKNPMFGVEEYLVFGSIATRTYVSERIEDFYEGMTTVFDALPGLNLNLEAMDGRNWTKMGPKPSQDLDGLWSGSESYMLSPPGGWNEHLYKLIFG